MAGIVGVINGAGREGTAVLVERMTRRLESAPWFQIRWASGDGWGLGQAWLGHWPGTQSPASGPAGRFHVALDGSLDNLDELDRGLPALEGADSQARRIARLLEQAGPSILTRLRGVFALAAVDTAQRTAYLVSDRFGLRPLYYAQVGRRLLWASKAAVVLEDPDVPRQVDAGAVAQLLTCQFVLGERTLLKAVRVLPPATVLSFCEGTAALSTYWELRFSPNGMDGEAATERFGELLSQAVNRVMARCGPVGVPLSSGIDSRTLAASIAPEFRPFEVFSFGFPWSHDVVQSRRVAALLGARQVIVRSDPAYLPRWAEAGIRATDGMVSCVHYHIYQLLDAMSGRVRCALDGLAGTGYRGMVAGWQAMRDGVEAQGPQAVFDAMWATYDIGVPGERLRSLVAPLGDPSAAESPRAAFHEAWQESASRSEHVLDRLDYVYIREKVRRWHLYGSTHLREQVEVAYPYLDYDLMDLLCATRPSIRTSRALFTGLYRKRWPSLGRVVWSATELPILATADEQRRHQRMTQWKRRLRRLSGRRISWTNRRLHTDYPRWFRGALAPWVKRLLLEPRAASRELVDPHEVARLWQEHETGEADRTWALGALVTLELWSRSIRGEPAC